MRTIGAPGWRKNQSGCLSEGVLGVDKSLLLLNGPCQAVWLSQYDVVQWVHPISRHENKGVVVVNHIKEGLHLLNHS